MDLIALNKKIEDNKTYQFFQRHERVVKIIEGVIIILLLISLNSYLFKDRQLKEQIASKCGWDSNEYHCVCTKDAVNAFINKEKGINDFNLSIDSNG